MKLPDTVRACLADAARLDLPFAVWRRPGTDRFEGLLSCGPVEGRRIFGGGDGRALFALNRFDAATANMAETIAGDIVFAADFSFFDGERYGAVPATAMQRRIAGAVSPDAVHAPDGGPVPAETGEAAYKELVAATTAAICAGRFEKAVLSRAEARQLAPGRDLLGLFEALAGMRPAAFVTLVFLPGHGAWLVATPETLLSVGADTVRTIALAGTQWIAEAAGLDAVEWPDKIVREQRVVVEDIRAVLRQAGFTDVCEQGPATVRAANLVHLRSDFSAPLGGDRDERLAALVERLHPTSAVCGMPKTAARDFLKANEGYDRGYYTGFLGPVNFAGRTDLFVNLRTAQIVGDRAFLYVGGGIVAGSDPQVEWQETVEKTKTVGEVFG